MIYAYGYNQCMHVDTPDFVVSLCCFMQINVDRLRVHVFISLLATYMYICSLCDGPKGSMQKA